MLVENWMATNVIAVKPDTSLLKCRNLLKEHQIRRLPVVDDQNRVVGIISDMQNLESVVPLAATFALRALMSMLLHWEMEGGHRPANAKERDKSGSPKDSKNG